MTFGLAEISEIEWFSLKNEEMKRSSIQKLEVLWVAGSAKSRTKKFDNGVCLTIIFGKEQEEQFNDICSIFEKNYTIGNIVKNDFIPFTIYLLGKNGIKIPTLCASGNGFQKLYGQNEETACLFTHTSPCIFDTECSDNNCPSLI